MGGNVARGHHYLPQFYLGGFTPSGTKDDFLWIFPRDGSPARHQKVEKVARIRDYYRVDGADDPGKLEKAFADLEGGAATVFRRLQDTVTIPKGDDYGILVHFLSLLVARVPRGRAMGADLTLQLANLIARVQFGDRRAFDSVVRSMKADGEDVSGMDYDKMKKLYDERGFQLGVTQAGHLQNLGTVYMSILPTMAVRRWTLCVPESGTFITSDSPVSISWRWQHTAPPSDSLYQPAFGVPETDVVFPVAPSLALVGRLEGPSGQMRVMHPVEVAGVNSRTARGCLHMVCSREPDFAWWSSRLRALAGGQDLLTLFRKNPVKTDRQRPRMRPEPRRAEPAR